MNPEERWITPKDLQFIYSKHRRVLITLFFLACAFLFIIQGIRSPYYLAEASFKQSGSKGEQLSGEFKNLLKEVGFQQSADFSAMPFMMSRSLLKKTSQVLGMQAHIESEYFELFLKHFKHRIQREMGRIPNEDLHFSFQDVLYEGERAKTFYLRFHSSKEFSVLNEKKETIASGVIGQPVQENNTCFTIVAVPEHLSYHKDYRLKLSPWPETVERVRRKLQIRPNKFDKNILNLRFKHTDRHLAADFLNLLMAAYQQYLKEENEQITQAQLVYLEKRQEELGSKMDKTLEEHAAYLKNNLGDDGFIALNQEIEILNGPKEQFVNRLFDLDLELKRTQRSRQANLLLTQQQQTHHRLLALTNADVLTQLRIEEKESLEGINLETARHLMIECSRSLDELNAKIRELHFVTGQLPDSHFELSSLGSILTDSVSLEMIQKAGQLALQLQDEENRSTKEQARLRETLDTQKQFILQHIHQMIDLMKLRVELCEEKLTGLQNLTIKLAKIEKRLIEDKLQEIRQKMSNLPEKWRLENQLKLKAELGKGMMEGMSRLVEFKNINHHLFQVESKPLDEAYPPVKSIYPGMLAFAFGGACLLIGLLFFFLVFRGYAIPNVVQKSDLG